MSQLGGYPHCQFPDAQLSELRAYVEKFLVGGGSGNTEVMKTDGDFTIDRERWVSWDVPESN